MEELTTQLQSSFELEYPTTETQSHIPIARAYVEEVTNASSVKNLKLNSPLPEQISTLLTNARLLFLNGENEYSFALVCEILKFDSYQPDALRLLSQIQIKKKNWPLAAKALETAVRQDYSFENIFELANVFYHMGDDPSALMKYEEAISILIESSPHLFELYKNMGNIHCRLGDFQSAEECYHKAFTINPQSDVLCVNLGTLEIQKSEFGQALVKFRNALEINPRNDKAWVGLAMVHDKMGDFSLAWANLENAIDLAPDNRTAVHILAAWALRDRKYGDAIEALQNYLSQVESDEEMSLMLIHLFCLTEDFEMAHLEIERVLLWNPDNEDVIQLLDQIPRKNVKC